MISDKNRELQVPGVPLATLRPRRPTLWYRLFSWLFGGKAASEVVVTRVHFNSSPETVWNCLMFYEELPGKPPFLLRVLLSEPIRTEGDKTRMGQLIRCEYGGGDLVKRITTVRSPHSLQFEIIAQRLGIEDSVRAVNGSYEINRSGDGSEVILITNYRAYLHPRYLWRPLEALLVGQLHNHILGGVGAAIPPTARGFPVVAESLTGQRVSPRGLTCTASHLRSPR